MNHWLVTNFLFFCLCLVQLGDNGESEGVVKVHTETGLAYVCSDRWTDEASTLVCEQMGYQYVPNFQSKWSILL